MNEFFDGFRHEQILKFIFSPILFLFIIYCIPFLFLICIIYIPFLFLFRGFKYILCYDSDMSNGGGKQMWQMEWPSHHSEEMHA